MEKQYKPYVDVKFKTQCKTTANYEEYKYFLESAASYKMRDSNDIEKYLIIDDFLKLTINQEILKLELISSKLKLYFNLINFI